jgi:hypothetical protein
MNESMDKYPIENIDELKKVLFHDYLLIKKMRSPINNKIKLLSSLFSINPNSWRVTGITPAALNLFKNHDFKKVSGMGINRSHIIQRHRFYKHLLEDNITNHESFWEQYYQNDSTILATSSENMAKAVLLTEIAIEVPADDRLLFRTAGFSWKHKDEEINFLKQLYNDLNLIESNHE